MQNSDTPLKEALEPVLRVLSQLGGHFTFTSEQGEQFVIMSREDFEASARDRLKAKETQLAIPTPQQRRQFNQQQEMEDVMEGINRDIALHHLDEHGNTADAYDESDNAYRASSNALEDDIMPPPIRVRFEPLRGDLPPELQE